MKRILITAKHSYIGNTFAEWTAGKYNIDFISCRTDEWKQSPFSEYDIVFHVAGIAHVSTDPNMEAQYYKVNRDLTVELAQKAKAEGVKQFIFMSSIIVYGDSSHINKKKVITINTVPQPANFYGNSKLQAEQGIIPLQDIKFNVVIIRPPLIYGKGSKGNYYRLAQMAQKLPIFPAINNQKSMIYIDNLCEFIRLMIENEEHGFFFPQNNEYVATTEMVKLISEAHGKQIRFTKLVNPLISLLGNKISMVNKAFGNLVYDKSMSIYKKKYCINDLKESIEKSEM